MFLTKSKFLYKSYKSTLNRNKKDRRGRRSPFTMQNGSYFVARSFSIVAIFTTVTRTSVAFFRSSSDG